MNIIKLFKKGLFIILSLAFLVLYLKADKIENYFSNKILSVTVLPMEQIEALSSGKEETLIEPVITFNGRPIAYDSGQNMLLIPQSLSNNDFEGILDISNGSLYFLEDEGFHDKATSISENRVFRLFLITDTQTWMYNVYFTGMPVAFLSSDSEPDEQGTTLGNIWIYDPYRSSATYQYSDCNWHKRGATTMNYDKASYRLTLNEQKLSFLGLRKDDDWILNALYDDNGLIHNKLSYDVWQEIAHSNSVANDEGISMEYLELFIDNEYRGVYGISERIDKKQLSLGKNDILYKYRSQEFATEEDYYNILTDDMEPRVTIEYPKSISDNTWNPMKEWISAFGSKNITDYQEGASLLNMENAIDYNLYNMLIFGMDNTMKNIYFDARWQSEDHYQIVKIPWDLNMTWGNSWVDDINCYFNLYQEKNITSPGGWSEDMAVLYTYDSKTVATLLYNRWMTLRKSIITEENIISLLDKEFTYLHSSGAYQRNYQKWPSNGDYWQDEYIYSYVQGRIDFLDKYYAQLYQGNQE